MFSKVFIFAAVIVSALAGAPLAYNTGYAAAPVAYAHHAAPAYFAGAVGAQAEHTVRGYGGLSTVSQYSKAVDSPFSSVRKTDTRVTNDAIHAYASPVAHHYAAAPAAYAAPALAHGYATAPALAHGYATAPALAHGYATAPALAHGYAGHGYATAPALAHGYAPAKSLSYSPVSPAVATLSYSTPFFNYGY